MSHYGTVWTIRGGQDLVEYAGSTVLCSLLATFPANYRFAEARLLTSSLRLDPATGETCIEAIYVAQLECDHDPLSFINEVVQRHNASGGPSVSVAVVARQAARPQRLHSGIAYQGNFGWISVPGGPAYKIEGWTIFLGEMAELPPDAEAVSRAEKAVRDAFDGYDGGD